MNNWFEPQPAYQWPRTTWLVQEASDVIGALHVQTQDGSPQGLKVTEMQEAVTSTTWFFTPTLSVALTFLEIWSDTRGFFLSPPAACYWARSTYLSVPAVGGFCCCPPLRHKSKQELASALQQVISLMPVLDFIHIPPVVDTQLTRQTLGLLPFITRSSY